ncbi:hypothetical protein [Providencia rettgeri]|uniref:hypothetical protein n=1 Tax=Providencia rettgeri TaxID=587 RepID=UPI00029C57C1|nr:hypothetical protein OOC_20119 [Providencia rettgeri Dmel1]
MAIIESEKILGIALLAERQQKELSQAIETMIESVTEFKSVSENVSQQVRQNVTHEIKNMNVGQLLGEQTANSFKSIERAAFSIKQQAEMINQETLSARKTLLYEYDKLKNRFWWFMGAGVIFAAGLMAFNSWYFNYELSRLSAGQNILYESINELSGKVESLNVTKKGK